MKHTYIGQTKLIVYGGRYFRDCEAATDAVVQSEWADSVLARPAVTYPNGRDSHAVAHATKNRAEDVLLDHWLLVV